MRPYNERKVQAHTSAPSDVAQLNNALVSGQINTEEAKTLLRSSNDSWWGVVGQFNGELATVDATDIVKVVHAGNTIDEDTDISTPDTEGMTGWLHGLEIVEVSPSIVNGHFTSGQLVVAAELHLKEIDGTIAFVAVSDVTTRNNRTRFYSVSEPVTASQPNSKQDVGAGPAYEPYPPCSEW